MKKKIFYVIATLAIIAIVVIRLKSNKDAAEDRVYQYDKNKSLIVQVDTVRLENIMSQYLYTGTFEPNKETKISSEIQGKINSMLVDAGSVVRAGQALIQLDNSLLKLQLQTIEVQIEGLETDIKRYRILTEADAIQGVQLEKAELGLKSAKIQKATVQEQISKTIIKAPFNGIVTAKLTELGAFAAPGVPLLQITDISSVKFIINVPEADLHLFHSKPTYKIIVDTYPDIKLSINSVIIGSKGNLGNSFPIQFTAKNTSDLKIKAGMFGKLSIGNAINEQNIIIPSSAIVGSNENPQVYTVKNGKATLQEIEISKRIQNKTVVANGLNAGDILIKAGFVNLFSGANVNIK